MGNKIQTYLGMRAVKPLTTNGQPASGEDFVPSLPNDMHEQAFETPKGLLSIWKTTVCWDFSGHLNMYFFFILVFFFVILRRVASHPKEKT